MLKCSKGAALGAVLCAFAVTAWGGPIEIPMPSATTAASPQPAYGAPGASTATAPAAASVSTPPAASAAKPAAAAPQAAAPAAAPAQPAPPKPKGVDYSYLDVSALLVQPFGDEDVGHGEKLTVSDALSEGAFVILDGARFDSVGQVRHSFDVGFGIDTRADPTRSFYATVTWTGVGFAPTDAAGSHGHGYALAGGVRVQPLPTVELEAEIRYDNNPALDGHTTGQLGMLYEVYRKLWLGFTLGTSGIENDYLLTLRWTF